MLSCEIKIKMSFVFLLPFSLCSKTAFAGESPSVLNIYAGSTPKVDGIIDKGEYDDAVIFEGVKGWMHQFNPVTDPNDYSIKCWVKHDGKNLYFAFDVTDDILYGIETHSSLSSLNMWV